MARRNASSLAIVSAKEPSASCTFPTEKSSSDFVPFALSSLSPSGGPSIFLINRLGIPVGALGCLKSGSLFVGQFLMK
jgi:hypothetical protein